MAGLKDKISSLKDGADTPMMKDVVQNATEFSGGEKQKLMIARSIYKGGVTVVLDEPTAALDRIISPICGANHGQNVILHIASFCLHSFLRQNTFALGRQDNGKRLSR